MNSQIYTVDELKKLLLPVLSRYPVKRGYIFGSYARGEATSSSDIDIFVEPAEGFKSYNVCGILSRAGEVLNKEVDCYSTIDFNYDTPIYETILRDRVVIYENIQ